MLKRWKGRGELALFCLLNAKEGTSLEGATAARKRAERTMNYIETQQEQNPSNTASEAKNAEARAFIRKVLAPFAASGERLTKEVLRNMVIAWRQAHQGKEGGEDLALGWVEGQVVFGIAHDDVLRERGWYIENAKLMKRVLAQLSQIDVAAIDYELEFGEPPPEEV